MSKLIYLVPLFPLLGFLINGLGRKVLSRSLISIIGCGVVLGSLIVSILIFEKGEFSTVPIEYFDFINIGSLRIPFAFQVDQLSIIFLLIITGVGFLIHVYSTSYMHDEKPEHFGRYFSYLNLFIFSMLLLVLGSNYVIMFIGWEGVGLCSYLLIGYWFKNTEYNHAAQKAFIMNRIGDLGFLIAIFWLIAKTGSVSFNEIFSRTAILDSGDVTAITLLLFVGAIGKSAQIPLYTWLPDAMAGPTPVSALIHAATMVTAGIYMIARSNVLYSLSATTQTIVAIVGLATAVLGASIALYQNDIKKVLAYSTVSQLGYMFLALGVGAYTSAVFHVMTHAFFKALLFLAAGSVIHAIHEQDIRNMGGLKKYLPITHITFLIGCLAIAGIPPFSGFFSKDEILMASYAQNPILYYVGLGTALLTAFYMFRLYAMTFLGNYRGDPQHQNHLHESPAPITIPLIVLAILSFAGGIFGLPEYVNKIFGTRHKLEEFLSPVVPHATNENVTANTEYILIGVSVILIVISIAFALSRYRKYQKTEEPVRGFAKVLQNKWYVDEIYDLIIVRPLNRLGKFFNTTIERSGIDGVVNGVGKAVQYGGRQLRWLQSGQVGSYVLLMVVSMLLFFVLQFFLRK
jgi:NADH-quinone oxidoreductase subunit L